MRALGGVLQNRRERILRPLLRVLGGRVQHHRGLGLGAAGGHAHWTRRSFAA